MTRSSASIRTSEPAYKAPVSQWQRERASGAIQPLANPHARLGRVEIVLTLLIVLIVSTIFFGKAFS